MYRSVGTLHCGNEGDLSHLRAVRTTSAHQFADDNNMYAFFMSAKSGDQVLLAFHCLLFFVIVANISQMLVSFTKSPRLYGPPSHGVQWGLTAELHLV